LILYTLRILPGGTSEDHADMSQATFGIVRGRFHCDGMVSSCNSFDLKTLVLNVGTENRGTRGQRSTRLRHFGQVAHRQIDRLSANIGLGAIRLWFVFALLPIGKLRGSGDVRQGTPPGGGLSGTAGNNASSFIAI
jgi:hypothetical protein